MTTKPKLLIRHDIENSQEEEKEDELLNSNDNPFTVTRYKNFLGLETQLLFEGIGSFLFFFLIHMAYQEFYLFTLGFWVLYIIFGQISAHSFNPSLSLAVYIYQGNYARGLCQLILFCVMQLAGPILCAIISRISADELVYNGVIPNSNFKIIFGEFLLTGLLSFGFLALIISKNIVQGDYALRVGVFAFWYRTLISGGTGGFFNLGVLFIYNIILYRGQFLDVLPSVIILSLAQMIGAVVFTFIFIRYEKYYIYRKNLLISQQSTG